MSRYQQVHILQRSYREKILSNKGYMSGWLSFKFAMIERRYERWMMSWENSQTLCDYLGDDYYGVKQDLGGVKIFEEDIHSNSYIEILITPVEFEKVVLLYKGLNPCL
jgi:hypothetical protein